MTFIPLIAPRALPPVGTTLEGAVVDWKVKSAPTAFEKAKDVAAFANHLGGALVLGAHAKDGVLVAYVGLDAREAAAVVDGYSKAVADLCQPRPVIQPGIYDHPTISTKKIIVINVWPSLNLVGTKVLAHENPAGYGGVSFVYPVRTGSDCRFLEPNELAMYMTPHVRRVAVMLSKIPRDAVVTIQKFVTTTMMPGRSIHEYKAKIDGVREEENVATFRGLEGQEMRRLPLDCIKTVYEDWDSQSKRHTWTVLVDFGS